MSLSPRFLGIDHYLARIQRGEAKAVLKALNAIKSSPSPPSQSSPSVVPLGVDYCRAMCFLSDTALNDEEAATSHGPLNARQAVLEELRWHPIHVPSRELLFELNEVIRPYLLPPADVQREEPLFSMLVDALLDYTMLTWPRLLNLFRSVQRVCALSSESGRGDRHARRGHVVECGCAGGGASVMLAIALREFDVCHGHTPRCVFALDSFTGMPPPSALDGLDTGLDVSSAKQSWSTGTCSAPAAGVMALAEKFGVKDRLTTIEGIFQHTIPEVLLQDAQMQRDGVDVLHVDADWYASVKCVLDHLLPVMCEASASSSSRTGSRSPSLRVVQIDDYHYWEGTRLAVDEALANWTRGARSGVTTITRRPPTLHEIDGNAVYFHPQ